MEDSITVYSLPTCGMCRALKQQLKSHSIEFTDVEDVNVMQKLGICSVPVMYVGNTRYSFQDALKWVSKQEKN